LVTQSINKWEKGPAPIAVISMWEKGVFEIRHPDQTRMKNMKIIFQMY